MTGYACYSSHCSMHMYTVCTCVGAQLWHLFMHVYMCIYVCMYMHGCLIWLVSQFIVYMCLHTPDSLPLVRIFVAHSMLSSIALESHLESEYNHTYLYILCSILLLCMYIVTVQCVHVLPSHFTKAQHKGQSEKYIT